MSWFITSSDNGANRLLSARGVGVRGCSTHKPGFLVSLVIILGWAGGCGSTTWFQNGFLDPTQVGQFKETRHNGIRNTLSILEEPEGIATAEEPRPEDLVPSYTETVIGPGDTIAIVILELLFPGQATEVTTRVGNAGQVTLPELGPIQVAGLGPRELEISIVDQLREAKLLEDADVRVTVLQSQASRFSVIGQVAAPGMYPITHPDFRMLDAIAAMGGVSPQIEHVYVFRRTDKAGVPPGDDGMMRELVEPTEDAANDGTEAVAYLMSDLSSARSPGAGLQMAQTHGAVDQLDPPAAENPGTPPAKGGEEVPRFDPETGEWVFDESVLKVAPDSKPLEPGPAENVAEPLGPTGVGEIAEPVGVVSEETSPVPTEKEGMETREQESMPVEWEVQDALEPPVRIIAVPVKELLDGNPQYNIVIRPSDTINVMGTIGEYYMMGNIARGGAYSITGRRITVKEAVAAAGGFGPLAWPARADLIRRVNQDEEQIIQLDLDEIFAGNAPDFYLRPNDILNVGTSPVSIFLAVLRNSFRFSYGLGLVYDRNFADSDSFVAREQVKARRAAEAARRGLPP